MTEFSKQELLRLVDKIPETDPTSPAYHMLMQSIECFNALALTVDEIIALRDAQAYEDLMERRGLAKQQAEQHPIEQQAEQHLIEQQTEKVAQDNVVPFTAPAAPWDEVASTSPTVPVEPAVEDKTVEEKTYAASDVRKALVEVKAKGVDVKEVLSEFGVTDFRALPAAKYGALMARLEAM